MKITSGPSSVLNFLLKDARVLAGALLIFLILAMCVLAPILSDFEPLEISGSSLLEPNRKHPLGTDDVGHDLFSQLLFGARTSALVGISVGVTGVIIALLMGGFAGYRGGAGEQIVMRTVDVFLCVPRFPILVVMAAFLGSSLINVVLFLILFSWPVGTRLVRSKVLSLKNSPLIEAEILFGARGFYIFSRHILPELIPLLIVIFVLDASHAVLAEAGLSFLGLGDLLVVSWGTILHYAFIYPGIFLGQAWLWWALPPGAGISIFVLGLMLISSGLEHGFNPKMGKESKIVEDFSNYV